MARVCAPQGLMAVGAGDAQGARRPSRVVLDRGPRLPTVPHGRHSCRVPVSDAPMLSPSIWPGGVSGTGRSVVGGRHLVSVNFWVPHLLEALYPPSTLELEVVVRTCCGSVGKPPAPTSRALTSPPWPCHSGSLTSHRPTPQSRAGGLCLWQEELTDGNRACLGTEAGACRPQPSQ